MGEERASGESGLGNFNKSGIYYATDEHLAIFEKANQLHSSNLDRLKCVHATAVIYNICKFASTLEATLMIRSRGEINI